MVRVRVVDLMTAMTVVCIQFVTTGSSDSTTCSSTAMKTDTLHERRLLNCLLHVDYNKAVRPASPDTAVHVVVDSMIATIIDLDEKRGVLTTDIWLMQTWNDSQLTWEPDRFGGLTEIRLPIDNIWNPGIVLLNNFADDGVDGYKVDKLAVINSSGVVSWTPHRRLRSHCKLDLSLFPFDTQRCHLAFGPLSYDKTLVTLSLNPVVGNHRRHFIENNAEWSTVGYSGYVRETPIGMVGMPGWMVHQSILFTFTVRRSSTFFKYTLITPSVLLTVLTLCLYWIPIQSGERFVLASGIFVSTMLLVALLEGYLPTSIGQLPVVASYIGYNLVLVVLSVIISIIVSNCHHRDVKRAAVPPIIRLIFLGRLSRFCCVNAVTYSPVSADNVDHASRRSGRRLELNSLETDPTDDVDRRNPVAVASSSSAPNLERTLADIRDYLRLLAAESGGDGDVGVRQGAGPSHRDLVVGEWQRVALVIDRVSFALLSFISVVVTIALYSH